LERSARKNFYFFRRKSLGSGCEIVAMKTRFLAAILILALAGSLAGLLLLGKADAPTLQELTVRESWDGVASFRLDQLSQTLRDGLQRAADLNVDSYFYALLAVSGVFLALRTLIYAARVYRHERSSEGRQIVGNRAMTQPAPSRSRTPLGSSSSEAIAARMRRVPARPSTRPWSQMVACGRGLTGRTILTFTAIIAMFGLLTMATVFLALTESLRKQATERARVTAVNVGDSAAGFLIKKNYTGLRDLLSKFTNLQGTAYVLIENRAGEILAHSFAVLPEGIRKSLQRGAASSTDPQLMPMDPSEIYEVAVPILEGQVGVARLGIWRRQIDAEIFETVLPLIEIIALVVAGGMVTAVILAWWIHRPILRLVNTARAISRGDLDAPTLGLDDATEFGELSRALERMRSSVKAAMSRLSQER